MKVKSHTKNANKTIKQATTGKTVHSERLLKKTPSQKLSKRTQAKPVQKIPSAAQVKKALNEVSDPETGIGLVDMGLIYGVEIFGQKAIITMTLTTISCPLGPQISMSAVARVRKMPGIKSAEVVFVFEPAWTTDKMNPKIKAMLFGNN